MCARHPGGGAESFPSSTGVAQNRLSPGRIHVRAPILHHGGSGRPPLRSSDPTGISSTNRLSTELVPAHRVRLTTQVSRAWTISSPGEIFKGAALALGQVVVLRAPPVEE